MAIGKYLALACQLILLELEYVHVSFSTAKEMAQAVSDRELALRRMEEAMEEKEEKVAALEAAGRETQSVSLTVCSKHYHDDKLCHSREDQNKWQTELTAVL